MNKTKVKTNILRNHHVIMMNYAYYYLRLNCNRDDEIITLMQHFTIIETSLLNTKEELISIQCCYDVRTLYKTKA